MSTEVKLPELGDGIESGDVLEIFVAVGDVSFFRINQSFNCISKLTYSIKR